VVGRSGATDVLPSTDPAGHGDPLMSASEWIAVPGAAGAAVLRTTDARPKLLILRTSAPASPRPEPAGTTGLPTTDLREEALDSELGSARCVAGRDR